MTEWKKARKLPKEVQFRGPYYVRPSEVSEEEKNDFIETIEGEFDITHEYLQEYEGYVIIKGVEGEIYPCALDIFKKTYEVLEDK